MGATANITAEQEESLTADEKRRLSEYRKSKEQPAVQTQSLAPMGVAGRGIVKGIPSVASPTPIGAPEIKDRNQSGPAEGGGGKLLPVENEAKKRLENSRAAAAAEDERDGRQRRQEELAAGVRASRRRGSVLTSPLGAISELGSQIRKTLLGL